MLHARDAWTMDGTGTNHAVSASPQGPARGAQEDNELLKRHEGLRKAPRAGRRKH